MAKKINSHFARMSEVDGKNNKKTLKTGDIMTKDW